MASMLELFAVVVLIAAWLIPNHYPPWASFYNELGAALGLMLIAFAQGRRWLTARISPIGACLVVVALIPVLQWSFGLLDYSGDAWISSLYLLGFASAITIGQIWAAAGVRHASDVLAGAVLAASLASSVLALSQTLELGSFGGYAVDLMAHSHGSANLNQPNNLGTLIGIGVLSLMLLREHGRTSATWGAAMLVLLLLGAGATQSRTTLLFGPLILFGLWLARSAGIVTLVRLPTVAAATVLHWLITWAWPAIQTALLLDAPASIGERSLSSGRIAAWKLLIEASLHSPWYGFGWLQVGAAQLSVAEHHPPISEKIWFQAHNVILDFVLWCGYPLGLLLCTLGAYWFVDRALKTRTREAMIGMLVVTLFGAHAMLELPHHYAYLLIPVGLWIGQVEQGIASTRTISARWMWAPVAVSVLMVLEICREYSAVEEDFRMVRFELLQIGTLRATQPAPIAPMLSSLTAFLRFSRTTPTAGMSDAQLQQMSASVRRYAYAPSMFRYSIALALNDRETEARQIFLMIEHVHGQATFDLYRHALRKRIAEGQTDLTSLEESLSK